jgi:hypothetical protein
MISNVLSLFLFQKYIWFCHDVMIKIIKLTSKIMKNLKSDTFNKLSLKDQKMYEISDVKR